MNTDHDEHLAAMCKDIDALLVSWQSKGYPPGCGTEALVAGVAAMVCAHPQPQVALVEITSLLQQMVAPHIEALKELS